jgi:hypothetical protein
MNSMHTGGDKVPLVGHDFEPFCEISVDTLNHHWVIVVAREDVQLIYSWLRASQHTLLNLLSCSE